MFASIVSSPVAGPTESGRKVTWIEQVAPGSKGTDRQLSTSLNGASTEISVVVRGKLPVFLRVTNWGELGFPVACDGNVSEL